MSNDLKEQQENLLSLVRELVERDKGLRDKYQIGDKFKFVRDRLTVMQSQVEENLKTINTEIEEQTSTLAEDELLVFVYLYNAQGLVFKTWLKMLSPAVFYEYSVNRPIYSDKTHIDSFTRNKPNRAQHAYLSIAVKKDDILPPKDDAIVKDANGNPLLKIKEGSLRIEKLFAFTHNEHDYEMSPEGELVRKI